MKILVAIANYGYKNMGFLKTVIKEYQSMSCRADIVVYSNIPKELGPGVDVRVGLPSRNPWSLPFAHKKLFADRANDYDLFIYTEDDTLITENNIKAFGNVTRILPENEIAGFLRYELDSFGKKYYSTVHSQFHWIPDSVKQVGNHTFARFTNDHSACYVLTKKQLKLAIDSGGYLVEPHDERYDLLVTAATDPYTQCGLLKVICISHLRDFEIHHLPNIYIGKLGLPELDFDLQIEALLKGADNGKNLGPLFPVETKLKQERWSKEYYEQCRNEIIRLIPKGFENILSIGCGAGATEEALVGRGLKVVAIPLDGIIGACAERKGIEVVEPDFEKAQRTLSRRKFDCIFISEVLQHLPDPVGILSKLLRLLTETGIIIISVTNFDNIKFRQELASQKFTPKEMRDFSKTGLHLTTKRIVTDWLRQCNMETIHVQYRFGERMRRFENFIPRVFKSLAATEYIVVARRLSYEN